MKRIWVCALLVAVASVGLAQTTLKFTLDWAYQGPQAPFLVALYKGYFAEEGLNVIIDRGYGSAGAVSQIAGGAYDLGYADINSMIEFNVANPDRALIAIAMVLDYAPFSIVTLKGKGIASPKDLEGKQLGAPAGDASRRLFPLFARAAGIDLGKIGEWTTMEPALRERLLIQGQVDAISAHFFTAVLNLEAAGVATDQIEVFLYADFGLDLYGNAVMCSPKLLQEKPEAVRAFLRALTKAWHDTIADPDEAIRILQRRDSLINPAVEKARLGLAIERCMLTPDVRALGFGDVALGRLERAIATVAEAFGLPVVPSACSVFTGAFLPPRADRLPK